MFTCASCHFSILNRGLKFIKNADFSSYMSLSISLALFSGDLIWTFRYQSICAYSFWSSLSLSLSLSLSIHFFLTSASNWNKQYSVWLIRLSFCHLAFLSFHPTYVHPSFPPTYLPTYPHTYPSTYLHTYPSTYIHSYPPTYTNTYIPTYIYTYPPTYLNTYQPTHLFTYITTYLHTHLHTCIRSFIFNCNVTCLCRS